MKTYDLIIIGSGPGGYRAAVASALRGLAVAVIEKDVWGGCCLNRGCVPKKTLYHTARRVQDVRHYRQIGISGAITGRLSSAWRYQHDVVKQIRESYLVYLSHLGVARFSGVGRLVGGHEVEVNGIDGVERLSGKRIMLATGSSAAYPAALRPEPGRILTTDDLFTRPPPDGKRVAIVGGGVVATEFAFILSHLGCKVFWVTRKKPLLRSLYSSQAMSLLEAELVNDDLELLLGSQVLSYKLGPKYVSLKLDTGNTLRVDWVLLATGRRPNTQGLGLESLGIGVDQQGFIERNEQLQTTTPHIYAIGDCANPYMSANHAIAEANRVVNQLLDQPLGHYDPLDVPQVLYSAVEIARVGLNEELAETRGFEPAIGFSAFGTSPAALSQAHPQGYVRLISDIDSGKFLGGEVVGTDAAELINLLSQHSNKDSFLAGLARGYYNHPSRSEEFLNAVETLAAKWGLRELLLR